ncbi:DNA recombination protein RmuC [Candidatus Saccharibacteria bacterium]|nr:DNA recombination protein RmuC [Candidatus Saccharibacteria bacterium]
MEYIVLTLTILNFIVLIFIFSKINKPSRDNSEIQKFISDEFERSRRESNESNTSSRNEVTQNLDRFNKNVSIQFERLNNSVETKLHQIQKDNTEQLEKMRQTVDEKLQTTLEKRLQTSFKSVSDNLERVQKGLGEMQSLASGVGDLKKVLSNVKTRGTWGEVQLSNLLEQILTQEQYEENIPTKQGSNDRVEFAILIPSKDDDDKKLFLPIDAKLPLDRYEQLVEASSTADPELVKSSVKALLNQLEVEAKKIQSKYIDPPNTTDFAIMYLPVEGLYAEVARQADFIATLQKKYRVVIAGPTTISALLNAFQMGFRSLAIQKRTSEVWTTLSEVQKHFGIFGDLLSATQKKLQEASNKLESASSKSRFIEGKLNKVQKISAEPTASNPEKLLP